MRHFSQHVVLAISVLHTLYGLTNCSFFESLDGGLLKDTSQVRNRRFMQAGMPKNVSGGQPPQPPIIPDSFPLSAAAENTKVTEDKPPTMQSAAEYLARRIAKWNRDGGDGGGYAYYPSVGGYDMAYSVILAMLAAKNQATTTTARPSRPQTGYNFPRPPSPSSSNNRPPASRPATRQKVPAAALAMLLAFLHPVYG